MKNTARDAALHRLTESKIFKTSLFSIASTTVLGNVIITPSLFALQHHFSYIGIAIETLSKLILTIPALTLIFFAPLAGVLYTRYKRLPIIFASLILWSLAGSAGFFLDDIYLLLISRLILGVAMAFLMTGIGVLIGDYYTGSRREKALAFQTFFMSSGGAVFVVLAGFLAEYNWRYPFLVYLLGFGILFFASWQLFEPAKHGHQTPANVCERFNTKKFVPVFLLAFFSMVCFAISPTQIPFFMEHSLGMKQSSIGISMAVVSVSMAFGSLFYQPLRRFFNIYEIFFIGFAFVASGFASVSILHNYFGVLLGFFLLGIALGCLLINNSTWLFTLASEKERPRAYGFLSSCMFMGQFASPLISQPIVHRIGIPHTIGLVAIFTYGIAFIFFFTKHKSPVAH